MLTNLAEFTVSEFSKAVKTLLEDSFGYVRITGEIFGSKLAASGHFYFNLCEDKAILSAVCFRGDFAKVDFEITDGMQVCVFGKISTFEGRSNYQIIVEKLEIAGIGAILAILQKRKEKLEALGLFAMERKKPLPLFPKIIAVISSKTGAVIEDIKHRILDRYPCNLQLFSAQMQGKNAASEVIEGIRYFNRQKENRPDVLIIARGGGSFEDLLPFSDEKLVIEASKSKIPLISAIGHETDNCLLDLVADLRAPTPTAAAELATPNLRVINQNFLDLSRKLYLHSLTKIKNEESRLKNLQKFLPDPLKFLTSHQKQIEENFTQIQFRSQAILAFKQQELQKFMLSGSVLERQNLHQKIIKFQEKLKFLFILIYKKTSTELEAKQQFLDLATKNLLSNSYQEILKRGFTVIRSKNGEFITSSKTALESKSLEIEFADGSIIAFPANPKLPSLF